MLERGRLYALRKDGSKDSVYLNIKQKRFIFGSSEYCSVRIYIDGVFSKHCILTLEDNGKAYLEPLHPLALIFVNGIKIKCKIYLEDNDVITIFIKQFQFTYPSNNLSRSMFIKRQLILCCSKQSWKTSHPICEPRTSIISYIPPKKNFKIESDFLKKISEYLLKFVQHESVNVSFRKIKALQANLCCSNNSLTKYRNGNFKESSEMRVNLAIMLYNFFCFIRGLRNRNEKSIYISSLLNLITKYRFARAKDVLYLPLKPLYFNYFNLKKINAHKKALHSTIHLDSSKGLSPICDITLEKKNYCIKTFEVSEFSDCNYQGNLKHDRQKQNSQRVISNSYKKRVSVAVKRYHLRKMKSIMSNSAGIRSYENVEFPDEKQHKEDKSMVNNSDAVSNLEKQKNKRTKRRQGYNKKSWKEREELQDERLLEINKGYKKRKEDPGKENMAERKENSTAYQIYIPKSKKQKQKEAKQSFEYKGLKQYELSAEQTTTSKLTEIKATKRSYKESPTNKTGKLSQGCNTQEIPDSRRITRSMARERR